MIGGSKNNREIIRENSFEHKRKKLGLDLNPGLSANRPSNNWAQGLSQGAPGEHSMASESSLHATMTSQPCNCFKQGGCIQCVRIGIDVNVYNLTFFFTDFHDHMLYYLEDLEPAVLLSALGT